jgi:Glycine transporter
VDTSSPLFVALDLTGVFAFAINGALTATRIARLDIVGVLALGMFTVLGGSMVRDILLGTLPSSNFRDWCYLAVAATGSLVAFVFGRGLDRVSHAIVMLDAAGLSLFAVTGALKGMGFEVGVAQATSLGAITAVGAGRCVMSSSGTFQPCSPVASPSVCSASPWASMRQDPREPGAAHDGRMTDGPVTAVTAVAAETAVTAVTACSTVLRPCTAGNRTSTATCMRIRTAPRGASDLTGCGCWSVCRPALGEGGPAQ